MQNIVIPSVSYAECPIQSLNSECRGAVSPLQAFFILV